MKMVHHLHQGQQDKCMRLQQSSGMSTTRTSSSLSRWPKSEVIAFLVIIPPLIFISVWAHNETTSARSALAGERDSSGLKWLSGRAFIDLTKSGNWWLPSRSRRPSVNPDHNDVTDHLGDRVLFCVCVQPGRGSCQTSHNVVKVPLLPKYFLVHPSELFLLTLGKQSADNDTVFSLATSDSGSSVLQHIVFICFECGTAVTHRLLSDHCDFTHSLSRPVHSPAPLPSFPCRTTAAPPPPVTLLPRAGASTNAILFRLIVVGSVILSFSSSLCLCLSLSLSPSPLKRMFR